MSCRCESQSALTVQGMLFFLQDGSLPDTLANVCNTVQFDGNVCQGFVYDSSQQVVFFKGQLNSQPVDISNMCSNPNTTTWLRKTG